MSPTATDDDEIRYVPSRSRPGVLYAVTATWCECEASHHGRLCRHRKEYLEEMMAAKATEPDAAPTAPANIDEAMVAIYGETGYVQKRDGGKLGYTYAGIGDIIYEIRPSMLKYGVTMRTVGIRNVTREVFETSKGGRMNRTTLEAVVRFTHGPSGTFVDCEAIGEGMDTGDKSSNKAMTGAFKYALLQGFAIETGDDPDDTSSKEQERGAPPSPAAKPQAAPVQAVTAPGTMVNPETGEVAGQTANKSLVGGESVKKFIAELKDLLNGLTKGGTAKGWPDAAAVMGVAPNAEGFGSWLGQYRAANPTGDAVAHIRDLLLAPASAVNDLPFDD